jgi:hypothetical protein
VVAQTHFPLEIRAPLQTHFILEEAYGVFSNPDMSLSEPCQC